MDVRKVEHEDRNKSGYVFTLDGAADLTGGFRECAAYKLLSTALGDESAKQSARERIDGRWREDGAWHDGIKGDDAMLYGAIGHDKYLAKTLSVMGEIEAKLGDTEDQRWDKSVVGYFPNVPAAIMGQPKAMMRLIQDESDRAPVTVWVNAVSSAGWDAEKLSNRGAAIGALCLKLSESRPVRLNVLVMLGNDRVPNSAIVVPCEVRGMNVSQLAHMVCSSSWARHIYTFLWAFNANDGTWDRLFDSHGNNPKKPEYIEDVKQFLGAAEQDLYIPPAFLKDELIAKDPVAWVERALEMYESARD